MKALLTLERRSPKGVLLDRRVQWSRSFTQNLMELLYVQHANLQNTAPRAIKDLTGGYRNIDVHTNGSNYNRNLSANLIVASGCGGSRCYAPTRVTDNNLYTAEPGSNSLLPGEIVGIQVGASNAVVTPQDYSLGHRIGHGNRGASVAASQLKISTGVENANNPNIVGYILPQHKFMCTSIKIEMYRSGLPGTLTLYVHDGVYTESTNFYGGASNQLATATTDGDTLPESPATEWREFIFAAPIPFEPGVVYRLYLAKSGAGSYYVRCDRDSYTPGVPWLGGWWSGTYSYYYNVDIWGTYLAEGALICVSSYHLSSRYADKQERTTKRRLCWTPRASPLSVLLSH